MKKNITKLIIAFWSTAVFSQSPVSVQNVSPQEVQPQIVQPQQQTENPQEAPAKANKEVYKKTTIHNDNSETSIFSIILGFILTLLVIAVPFIGGKKKK